MKRVKLKGAIKSRIKRGDDVVFVAGKEFNRYDSDGKRNPYQGKVIAVDARTGRIKVDGAMIVKKHRKPVPQMNIQGGIIKKEAWVDISNVAIVDPDTGKPTRVTYEERDGKKVRIAKSGAVIPDPGIFSRVKKEEEPAAAEETPAEEEVVEKKKKSKKSDEEE